MKIWLEMAPYGSYKPSQREELSRIGVITVGLLVSLPVSQDCWGCSELGHFQVDFRFRTSPLKKSASKAIDPTRKITSTLYGSGPQYDSQKVFPESYSFMDVYLCNFRCPTFLSVFKLVFTQLPLKIDASRFPLLVKKSWGPDCRMRWAAEVSV